LGEKEKKRANKGGPGYAKGGIGKGEGEGSGGPAHSQNWSLEA